MLDAAVGREGGGRKGGKEVKRGREREREGGKEK